MRSPSDLARVRLLAAYDFTLYMSRILYTLHACARLLCVRSRAHDALCIARMDVHLFWARPGHLYRESSSSSKQPKRRIKVV